jgi:hypothetical protein
VDDRRGDKDVKALMNSTARESREPFIDAMLGGKVTALLASVFGPVLRYITCVAKASEEETPCR